MSKIKKFVGGGYCLLAILKTVSFYLLSLKKEVQLNSCISLKGDFIYD